MAAPAYVSRQAIYLAVGFVVMLSASHLTTAPALDQVAALPADDRLDPARHRRRQPVNGASRALSIGASLPGLELARCS